MAKNIKDYYAPVQADDIVDSDGDSLLAITDDKATLTGTLIGDVNSDADTVVLDASTGVLTGSLVGDVTGDVTGNADTATSAATLTTTRTIGGTSFDGSQNINPMALNNVNGSDDDEPSQLMFWTGTQAEYDAIVSKDDGTLYFIK